MVNPFRCKMLHKKASLAVLSDERNARLFDADEREAIAAHIPWTRVGRGAADRLPTAPRSTWSRSCAEHREQLVLKPNDDYGGKGIVLGWEVDDAEWEAAVRDGARRAVHRAGARSRCRRSRIRAWWTAAWQIVDRMLDTAPFVAYGESRRRLPDAPLDGGAAQRHGGRRLDRADLRRRTAVARSETLMKAPSLTLGIEEEYQIIDPETRELQSYITEILERRSHHPRAR